MKIDPNNNVWLVFDILSPHHVLSFDRKLNRRHMKGHEFNRVKNPTAIGFLKEQIIFGDSNLPYYGGLVLFDCEGQYKDKFNCFGNRQQEMLWNPTKIEVIGDDVYVLDERKVGRFETKLKILNFSSNKYEAISLNEVTGMTEEGNTIYILEIIRGNVYVSIIEPAKKEKRVSIGKLTSPKDITISPTSKNILVSNFDGGYDRLNVYSREGEKISEIRLDEEIKSIGLMRFDRTGALVAIVRNEETFDLQKYEVKNYNN